MNGAIGIQAAGTWTRILASFADASLIARTVRRDDTLGTTVGRRADIIDRTGTRRVTVDIATLRVRSAWGRYARVRGRTW